MSVSLLGLEIPRIRKAVITRIYIPRNSGVGVVMHELCGKQAKPLPQLLYTTYRI